jgi:membrane-associated protease RseP (regulator of RpoE activity)
MVIVTELISSERIDKTWHGIVGKQGSTPGLVVETVHRESPAESAGVRAGDVITQIADVAVSSQLDVERAMLGRKAGDSVLVSVNRGGEETKIEVPLPAPYLGVVPSVSQLLIFGGETAIGQYNDLFLLNLPACPALPRHPLAASVSPNVYGLCTDSGYHSAPAAEMAACVSLKRRARAWNLVVTRRH